jgi:hypothetical protein
MTWHSLPDTASLSDWCSAYRFAGLDVTVRGGAFVGLWIGEHLVALDVDDAIGERVLAVAPTPTLARVGRSSMLLLAVKDIPVSGVDCPDADVLAGHVFRLPTGHPADPYLWRITPDVRITPLSELLKALR